MKPSIQRICDIDVLKVAQEDTDVGVIFLHGYGANMQDLFPLWQLWHQNHFTWYFPNGVGELPMQYYGGRSWFSIDMARLEAAMRSGLGRQMASEIPVELEATLNQLEKFILEISQKHKKIILGGFSQGAMCSSHLVLRDKLKIDGLVLLSGNLVAESLMKKPQKEGISFYQSHGTQDPILEVAGAKALEEKLKSFGFKGQLEVFTGGHEIPQSVIGSVKKYLSQF
jgi:phospholipase/carboxylesterase